MDLVLVALQMALAKTELNACLPHAQSTTCPLFSRQIHIR
jgi:hypothetical protein